MFGKSYIEHDDRTFRDFNRNMGRNRKFNRGGGQRSASSGGYRSQSNWRYRDRDRDSEGDVDMAAGSSNRSHQGERRFGPYKPGQGFYGRRRQQRPQGRKNLETGDLWFKITIPYVKKAGKQFVLKSLQSHCSVPFNPYNFHFNGTAAVFFVDNINTANAIAKVNKIVTLQDGFKMTVYKNDSGPPITDIDEDVQKQIKLAMNRRYNIDTRTLDLDKFYQDVGLRNEGLYVPLHRPVVLINVVKIIKEHIPQLEALNLSNNGLYSLQTFSSLVPVCKNLSNLSLANNKLKSIKEMDHLKGLNITALLLDGNTLCDDFKDKDSYISALRNRFPKLTVLDGYNLPAPITFDLGTTELPASKGSYLTESEEVKVAVIQFLEHYYMLYDCDEKKDREKLLEKYHDASCFSFCLMAKPNYPKGNKNTSLVGYVPESRNLLRVSDSNYRYKLLKQGRLSIVSSLTSFPATQHDPNSFMVDVAYVTPLFIQTSVTGVFKEVAVDMLNQPLRTFKRDFILTLNNNRWVILNDMLTIGDATPEQVKAFKAPAPTPSPSPAPAAPLEKSPNEKQLLAIEFSKQTGMNLDFSIKCLEENDWDFQKSSAIFQELRTVPGKIPPEAFIMDDRQRLTIEFVKLTGMNIDFSAKCLGENNWDFQKASLVFQGLNSSGRIPAEAFINKSC